MVKGKSPILSLQKEIVIAILKEFDAVRRKKGNDYLIDIDKYQEIKRRWIP